MRDRHRKNRILAGAIGIAALAGCGGGSNDGAASGSVTAESLIDNDIIAESSGLARSRLSDDRLWTHNDSGDGPSVYAIDTRGHYLGALKLRPALALDWEDMAGFEEDGQARLLLADIGDNSAIRPFVTLYVVEEPMTSSGDAPFELSVAPLRSITLIYPDGPRDAESVAVDESSASIFVLSKRDAVPQLYRVPLQAALPLVIAEPLGEITIPRAEAGSEGADSFNFTTAMDISADGRTLVVSTYTHAYRYTRSGDEDWPSALLRAPRSIRLPDYAQIEAASLSADGATLWITSEGAPAPLARLDFD